MIEGKVPPPSLFTSSHRSPSSLSSTASSPRRRSVVLLSLGLVLAASIRDTGARCGARRPSPSLSRVLLRHPSFLIRRPRSFSCVSHGVRPPSSVVSAAPCGLCCRYRDTDPYPKPRPRAARFYVCRRELMHRQVCAACVDTSPDDTLPVRHVDAGSSSRVGQAPRA